MSQIPENRLGIVLLCLVLFPALFCAFIQARAANTLAWMRAIIATRSYPVAARFFRRNLQQQGQESTTHFLLAKSLIGQGDHTAARVEIDRALALSPNRPEFVALREQLTGGSVEDRSVSNFFPKQRAFESQRTTVCGPRVIEPLRERKQFPRIEL